MNQGSEKMKKFIGLFLLVLLLSPFQVWADGYIPEDNSNQIETKSVPTPTPTPEVNINSIDRQDVKSPNQKQSSTIPFVLTIAGIGMASGGYYLYQKNKRM